MIRAKRFELGTATINPVIPATWSRQSKEKQVKYNKYSLLKIILILCCINNVYCDNRYDWIKRFSRGINDLRLAMTDDKETKLLHGRCNMDSVCKWYWQNITSNARNEVINTTGIQGSYLQFYGVGNGMIYSEYIPRSGSHCHLTLKLLQKNMKNGVISFIIDTNNQSYVASERSGNNNAVWEFISFNIGAIQQKFRLIMEFLIPYNKSSIGVDDIRLIDCFPEYSPQVMVCTDDMFRCNNGSCLNRTRICDLSKDCVDGEDEGPDCDKMPPHARCNFENGWCGWRNVPGNVFNWTLHCGPTPTERSGPSYDHTYRNATGTYVYVNTARGNYGYEGLLESPLFNPTPPYSNDPNSSYHHSCQIRFFYHRHGVPRGSLGLFLVQVKPHRNSTQLLWWSSSDRSDDWYSQAIPLPEVRHRYYFLFEIRKGYGSKGDIAIDDISLSPECFGIGVPPEVVGSFDYNNPIIESESIPEPHVDFVNKTVIHITTCGAIGRVGPTAEQCMEEHNATNVKMVELPSKTYQTNFPFANLTGIQSWIAPSGGYYTLIGMGARGGRGAGDIGNSLGAFVRGVVELEKGDQLYFMIGQPGTDACPKNLGWRTKKCNPRYDVITETGGVSSVMEEVRKMEVKDGSGGGGGATYIFTLKNNNDHEPLLIAAGGGGLGLRFGPDVDDGIQHGKGLSELSDKPHSGLAITDNAGPGGGWNSSSGTSRVAAGIPLVRGGYGGAGCGSGKQGYGNGGFGGGGGGCLTGGGGGGYIGGSTGLKDSGNGEGGYSYVSRDLLHVYFKPAANAGPGEVYIIPAISNCGCDFRCVALDQYLSDTKCLCPLGWILDNDSKSCNMANDSNVSYQKFMISLIVSSSILLLVFTGLGWMLYNRYQNRKALLRRRQAMFGNGTELTALGVVSDSMMTEFNPNYEFAGNLYSIKDLYQIPREHITLVKPLGQGAFGEVFQGVYKYRRNEEHPVAVKTLPSLTTSQAEADFMMEALIMSKFSHPNIVHFIGVSFDKHPRYIVLELLAGGDLKNFLREERPKPDRPTTLNMYDLIMCGYNVADGCKYMEEARFIHRDIAARNCLLTCKGSGRIVKIADFGMARDIYRSDYYRKGGKAMLPIKWMPPESFLDGIFTTKTDVWAFGVLLWEIMSFGYMPYTGCANREVMTMVTSGGRLEKPAGCPDPIYGIMTRCWHPRPEDRPSFATITERIDYCLQDPDVINHPTPNYDILPACDREITIMRPDPETECINVNSDSAFIDGYMQPRDMDFRSVTYRIEPASNNMSYTYKKKYESGTTNDNLIRTRDIQQPGQSNSYKDNTKNINNEDNSLGNARAILDNDVNTRTEDERNETFRMNDETKEMSELSDNGNEPPDDQDDRFSENSDGTDLAADRKNGNESTTTTDTNSDSMAVVPANTSTDTTSNSTPNTRTCSPNRIVLHTNVNNVNGILKKSTLKAALSLDPSTLYRGTIHYEKIPFSAPPQRSSTPGSIELTKDSLGHELPRQEECSC
ncbi:PREDICTED: ALK tyrosine kinase receptor [Polistes canadensis]|uniref:ALK tyrosine kinase receptor n=1 Tax=Polistes canadensis TaxID=91411 RepID=UPI000718FF5B|nr:PREDICTED: ALK tyrosine kinase receptor [Polistes canadensis]XP_014612845.1 PREDICTED: ALK tyrosine kinase receptor [Polistes canadensis]XP_014612846.1 PREDICTED: ALK tyrosine kinase receptor [Polistes canadensis]